MCVQAMQTQASVYRLLARARLLAYSTIAAPTNPPTTAITPASAARPSSAAGGERRKELRVAAPASREPEAVVVMSATGQKDHQSARMGGKKDGKWDEHWPMAWTDPEDAQVGMGVVGVVAVQVPMTVTDWPLLRSKGERISGRETGQAGGQLTRRW